MNKLRDHFIKMPWNLSCPHMYAKMKDVRCTVLRNMFLDQMRVNRERQNPQKLEVRVPQGRQSYGDIKS